MNGGLVVYIIGTILWFTQETGRSVPLFPLIYYGAGCIALVTGSIFAGPLFADGRKTLQLPAIWLCAFGGMIGGATVGNFCSLVLYKLPREIWLTLTLVAPLERAAFSLGAALIGTPLLAALPRIGISVGPGSGEPEPPEHPPVNNEPTE
jgi:hypothetical protein